MKRYLIWLALAATLIATYFAPRENDAPVVVPAKTSQDASQNHLVIKRSAQKMLPEGFDFKIHPRNDEQDLGNVFASRTWTPPPPKVIAQLPKSEQSLVPEAPPLPFQYLGRWIDDGKAVYFFQFNDRNLVMHVGDTIDKTYTLESISGGTLTFAYLPLNKKQTMAVGEVN